MAEERLRRGRVGVAFWGPTFRRVCMDVDTHPVVTRPSTGGRNGDGQDGADMSGPEVSVVVCSYNRAERLARCLEALGRQTFRDRMETIVVDDASTDGTAEVAAAFGVRLVRHRENGGPAAARTSGARSALAPIVAFTDDDCVPAETWLEELVGPYARPEVVGVGGAVEPLEVDSLARRYAAANNPAAPLELELELSNSVVHRARLYARRNVRGVDGTKTRVVSSFVGANMSFRRDVLAAVGFFDSTVRLGEDEDVCRRIRRRFRDSELRFSSAALVAHDYDPRLRGTLARGFAYGGASALTFVKNEEQRPTVFPFPVAVAVAASVALGARRPSWLAAAAVLPLVMFPRWTIEAVRRRRTEYVVFPYLQLCEEAAHDLGFVRRWATTACGEGGERDSVPSGRIPLAMGVAALGGVSALMKWRS